MQPNFRSVPTVAEVLRARSRHGIEGEKMQDGYKLALVLEGGGMRGAYLAGLLQGLENAGLRGVFDSVHASSVGSHLGAYFLAGQARLAAGIFIDDALRSEFIDFTRIFRGGPIMSIDWMVREIYLKRKKIDVAAIEKANIYFDVIATNAKTGQAYHFVGNELFEQPETALRATAKIPFVAGEAVEYGGNALVDGGIAQQIPVQAAIEVGATHILVLTNRKKTSNRMSTWRLSHLIEWIGIRIIYGKELARQYHRRRASINQVLDNLDGKQKTWNVQIDTVFAPEAAPNISRMTRDKAKLETASRDCVSEMERFLHENQIGPGQKI